MTRVHALDCDLDEDCSCEVAYEELELFAMPAIGPREVAAATAWPSNAELVIDLCRLGYLPSDDAPVLDPTHGRGGWWAAYRPAGLVATDLADGTDVRALPYRAEAFAAAVFDPPHVATADHGTTTVAVYRDRYGLTTTGPRNAAEVAELYRAGIFELFRVLAPAGHLTVKATDHVDGRLYRPMAHRVTGCMEAAGFRIVDVLVMLRNTGPLAAVPAVHSRRNYSVAVVGRKPSRGGTHHE